MLFNTSHISCASPGIFRDRIRQYSEAGITQKLGDAGSSPARGSIHRKKDTMNAGERLRYKTYLPLRPWPKKSQPRKVVKVLHYAVGYEVRTEIVDNLEYMGPVARKWQNKSGRFMVMRSAYTPKGDYIGNPKFVRFLFRRGIRLIEKAAPSHSICSIGFNAKEGKWYGWSHRAICGFGLGDRIFNERWKKATGKTPFIRHGDRVITQYAHAKLAAKRFARSVS